KAQLPHVHRQQSVDQRRGTPLSQASSLFDPDLGVDHAAAAGGGAAVRRGVCAWDDPDCPDEDGPEAAAGGGAALRRDEVDGADEGPSPPARTGGACAVRGRLVRVEGTGASLYSLMGAG
ncbi:MAG: hypothetical protein KDJ17_12210, partial [Hyphomicrobiaceae bacterium]|nr:hypothetical protein [Hyphomicrobiaceae bacterium]